MLKYSDKVLNHFMNPRNVGELEHPDAEAQVGSLICGDMMKLQMSIDEHGIIRDAKFKTFGCGAAIASASVLTEMLIGKHINDAVKITKDDIIRALDGLPDEKVHCSVMGTDALRTALADYFTHHGITPPPELDTSSVVCNCFGITERTLRETIKKHRINTLELITATLQAGAACGKCKDKMRELIIDVWGESIEEHAGRGAPGAAQLADQQITRIERVIEQEIRPSLQRDGGDIRLVCVEANTVKVAFEGLCRECPASPFTLKGFVQKRLRDRINPEIVVEEDKAR